MGRVFDHMGWECQPIRCEHFVDVELVEGGWVEGEVEDGKEEVVFDGREEVVGVVVEVVSEGGVFGGQVVCGGSGRMVGVVDGAGDLLEAV